MISLYQGSCCRSRFLQINNIFSKNHHATTVFQQDIQYPTDTPPYSQQTHTIRRTFNPSLNPFLIHPKLGLLISYAWGKLLSYGTSSLTTISALSNTHYSNNSTAKFFFALDYFISFAKGNHIYNFFLELTSRRLKNLRTVSVSIPIFLATFSYRLLMFPLP